MKKIEKLTDLQPDPDNANDGTARGLSAVEESIQKFGGGRSILAERDGIVLAGNKTLDRAVELGLEPVIVHTNGKQLVVVVRDDLSLADDPAKARGLAYADNRASELGLHWNPDQIKRDLDEGLGFAPVFFTEEEISNILNRKPVDKIEGHTDPDEAPEPAADVGIVPGDIFHLGKHVVMCGDSRKVTDVEKLMHGALARMVFTDPPYGVDYDGGDSQADEKKKQGKKIQGDKNADIYGDVMPVLWAFTEKKAPFYVWYAGSESLPVFTALKDNKITLRNLIVWVKNRAQHGALSAQYKQQHELCIYGFKHGEAPWWYGPTTEVTTWEADRAVKNEFHPTQKPVALAERAINNSSLPNDLVLDLFGGSGSTLIACEQMSRQCRMMELDPRYVDVIIRRWEAFTKTKASKAA